MSKRALKNKTSHFLRKCSHETSQNSMFHSALTTKATFPSRPRLTRLYIFPKSYAIGTTKQSVEAPQMDLGTTSLQKQLHTTHVDLFDEFDYDDDDVFYVELRRQVLQLTAEDDLDDEAVYVNKNPNTVETRKQGLNDGFFGVTEDRGCYNWPGNKEDLAAPARVCSLWRTGNGTGVFIPQTVQSRPKNRSRRKKNERRRTYKQVEKMA